MKIKKRVLLAILLVVIEGVLSAQSFAEQSHRRRYDERGFVDRSDWLYEFNSVAVEVADRASFIVGEKESVVSTSTNKMTFDNECAKYRVLLDIGVERGFIDDRAREQQMNRLTVEKDRVSRYLAQQSSGLGL